MPLYDYRCQSCGKEFEVQQRMTEDSLSKCIYCEGPVQRLISAAGIVFKGSGFHITDYRPKAKSEAPSPSPSSPKTDKKETKPVSSAATATPPAVTPTPRKQT